MTTYEQQDDPFLQDDVERYQFAQWLNGQQVYDSPDGDVVGVASGWHIRANEDETDELNLCLDSLCERWEQEVIASKKEKRPANQDLHCQKVYIKFRSQRGSATPFYFLRHFIVYPLAYGVPSNRNEIWYKPEKRQGVASFWETPINRDTRQPEGDAIPYIKILVVSRALYEANYLDSNGRPIPLMLTTKKSSANFLYSLLLKQMDVVRLARENGIPATAAQFYTFCMTLYAGKDQVEVGTAKKSFQYPLLSTTPDRKSLSYDFVQAQLAEDDLQPLLKEQAKMAVEWSRVRIDAAIKNQLQYGDATKQDNMLFSDGRKARDSETVPAQAPAAPAVAMMDEQQRAVLKSMILKFKKAGEENTVAAIEEFIINVPTQAEAGKAITKYGEEYRKLISDPYA